MITVASVWVKGHVPYTAEYVEKLRSMVARHLPVEHRFVCLTDQPEQLSSQIEAIPVNPPRGEYAWWTKLSLFDEKIAALQSGRILYLDLDVLVVSSLLSVVHYPATFALVPDGAPHFLGKGQLKTVKKFNSSVMVWNGGAENDLFSSFNPKVMRKLWGDQDWIGQQRPDALAMPKEWFPRLSQTRPPWEPEVKVVLCKKPKNAMAADRYPWFAKEWA